MREQWLRRLLKNPLLASPVLLEPWARQALAEASRHGQTVVLSLDQTDLGDRFAVLMLGLVMGDRALPLAWTVEGGPANLGFARPAGRAGAGTGMVTGRGGGAAVGGSLLSVRRACLSGCTRRVGSIGCA